MSESQPPLEPYRAASDAPSPAAPSGSGRDDNSRAFNPVQRPNRLWMLLKVIEVRLRFVLVIVATGLVIGYWDMIKNYWDKWTQQPAGVTAAPGTGTEYYCPMHPNVIRSGLDADGEVPKCPICGMKLSLRRKNDRLALPDGILARVQLSPERIRLAGIETVSVAYQPLKKEIQTVGYVGYDESRLSRIVSRVTGYLEKLYVDRTWISVNEGDPLAEIYSPELYSAARELLLAAGKGNKELEKSGRERLRLLGIGDSEIDEIVTSGKANHRLVLRAPHSGHVIRKEVVQGDRVDSGKTLFEVVDLTAVWVEADVYEKDIPFLRVGQAVEATVEAVPNRVFHGRSSLVHPHLEPMTRTNAVRIELENPQHELRPGMFANVRIEVPFSEIEPFKTLATESGEVLAVADRSVIDTGSTKIVYVEREPGLFDAVLVELGPHAAGFYPVVSGLEPGERVAAAGAFLIDAETRLNPDSAASYIGAQGGSGSSKRGSVRLPNNSAPSAGRSSTGNSPERTGSGRSPRQLSDADRRNLEQLSPGDRTLALAQANCPISGEALGSMGVPFKMTVQGKPVFLCCSGCEEEVTRDPAKVLRKLAETQK